MKPSLAALALGIPLLAIGVFLMGDRSGRINFVGSTAGLALIAFAVARLVWLGWHGANASWLIAALPAAILTWTLYEVVRQAPPYPPIGVLGTSTAPALSALVTTGIVAVGWFRHRSRQTHQR